MRAATLNRLTLKSGHTSRLPVSLINSTISSKVADLTDKVDAGQIDGVLTLLKDSDVLTLLEKSRARLSTLVDDDLPEVRS